MSLNLYSDPGLAATYVPYPLSGGSISQSGNSLIFDAALNTQAISLPSGDADFLDRIASGGTYHISVFVSGYVNGSPRAKLCGGSFVSLGVTADGWSAPVAVVAGTSRGLTLGLFGIGTGCSLTITPDANNEAIRITT